MTPQDELPQVLMTPFELIRAAQGHPMTVRIQWDSTEVCVRIPTVKELAAMIDEAQRSLPFDARPPAPTHAQLVAMTNPLTEGA